MEILALLLIAPLVWPFVAWYLWKHEITIPEAAANLAVGVLVVTAGWFAGTWSQTADTEIINGEVLSKARETVSCSHSYECNCSESCSTDSNGSRSCTKTCSTCYEHWEDYDWVLTTNVGSVEIDRVDRQGETEPKRFSLAKKGDPVARSQHFTNYVKGAPDSLFNSVAEQSAHVKFQNMLPAYPGNIHDYHYANRVLTVGVNVPDLQMWNLKLANALKTLGPQKQANAVIVFTSSKDPSYAAALRAHWLGGKKNDIVLVIGAPNYPEVEWASVISWTDNQLFKVQLGDALRDLKTVTADSVIQTLSEYTMKQFKRKEFEDFKYLDAEIAPPMWAIVLLFVLGLAASIGASIFFSRNEIRPFGTYGSVRWHRGRRTTFR